MLRWQSPMADHRQPLMPTGGRDDLQIEASRCLLMRFSESSCRRCLAVCPHGAVGLDGMLSINPNNCTGCLLCTAECPAGALEQSKDFAASLLQLSRVPAPILGCLRTKDRSHATLACLGGLSEEHLVTLCHSLPGRLTLNLTACGDCPNKTMISLLQQRLDSICEAGLSGRSRIVIAESAQDISFCDESVGRRSFFKAFGNSLFKSTAVLLSTTIEQAPRRTEYAGKRLPIRKELLQKTRSNLSPELEVRMRRHFDSCVSFDDTCTRCQGCAAICPTGALKAGLADSPPVFNQLHCTGCGLCREFCLEGALRITEERCEGVATG